MSTLKNIFKYFGILLGLCLAVILIILGGMVVFRFELFGYRYFKANLGNDSYVLIDSNNKDFGEKLSGLTMGDILDKITTLTINSKNIDVYVRPYIDGMQDEKLNIGPYKIVPLIDAQGFAKFEENEKELEYNVDLVPILDNENNETGNFELVVTIKVPSGFASYGNSYLTVYTPFYANELWDATYLNGKKYNGDRNFTSAFGLF